MKNEFVPYELALKLKQLGFDEEGFIYISWYNPIPGNNSPHIWSENGELPKKFQYKFDPKSFMNDFKDISFPVLQIPTFSQAFRWFREEHKLFVSIEYSTRSQTDFVITINKIAVNDARDEDYKTYEVAELAALDKLIEIVEIKQRQPNIPEWDGPYSF